MGLFSKSGKNKQDAGQDSGYYTSADDQAATERARSKRASSADGPKRRSRDREENDPVLPEKKRARRRLVGAIMLALGVAVGLPMLLDSEPKQMASDIEIKIPSKDKPAEVAAAPAPAASVPANAALDSREEIVEDVKPAAKPAAAPVAAAAAPVVAAVDTTKQDAARLEAKAKADARAELMAKAQADAKAERELKARQDADTRQEQERKQAEAKAEARLKADKEAERKLAEAKAAKAAETKPAAAPSKSDDARALAILEGKGAAPAAEGGQKFVLQVAALSDQGKADELRAKLKNAGISSFTQKTPSGITRVRVGPFSSKEEAEKVKAKLTSMGLDGRLETV
ncbi:sporulation protein [Duganella sp. FT134W]|uniref:Sporulation protein n=1 Tax=Duganella margarita TaxID=2692170 RepID=A0A7X4KJT2_9BURK|nr:SPOR domain-containing protein [Duganella margarita]MYM75910.1 sporulation protein [Duganella margarita]